jgi:hypothetical protein
MTLKEIVVVLYVFDILYYTEISDNWGIEKSRYYNSKKQSTNKNALKY